MHYIKENKWIRREERAIETESIFSLHLVGENEVEERSGQ